MASQFGTTQAIALFFSLYLLAAGIRVMSDRGMVAEIFADLRASPLVTYLCGLVAFVTGAAVVAVHNVWNTPLEIIVSLVGWAALVEGVLLVAIPQTFLGWFSAIADNRGLHKVFGGVTLAFGVLLLLLIFAI
ncbi:hypothetical protein ACKTEK_02915 [Tepidamorphus sp. 3E244]|uniref:hypothetical protein n=1 Tax=Tepidamorphus sp. 3E244 TaxID=3385498 RepID=UPI0038FC6A86